MRVDLSKIKSKSLFRNQMSSGNIVLPLMFILLPLAIFGQNLEKPGKSKVDTIQYYSKYDTLINIKLSGYNLDERFTLEGKGFHYKIQPNFTLKTKIFFSYKFLSFAIAFAPKFIPGNSDSDLKGKTSTFTFNMNVITRHWVQYLQFNHTKGFYLKNTADYQEPGWQEGVDPYIQFPDLRVYAFRGATSYLINSKFSLKAVLTQTEVQQKSTGSFMPSLIYSYIRINNQSDDPAQTTSQKSDNLEILAAIWYMHTFVIYKKWFISGGLAPSVGYSFTKLTTYMGSDSYISHYNNPVLKINEQASIGFNTHRFFAGAVVVANQTMQNQGDNPIKQKTLYTTFHAYIGYRFGAPKPIRKTFSRAEGLVKKK